MMDVQWLLAGPLLLLLLLLGGSAALPPYERAAVPRFPIEGGGSCIICDTSLQTGTALRARVQSVGCFLQQTEPRAGNCLIGTVGHPTDADMIELPTPVRHNESCLQVDAGKVTHPGPGLLSVSVNGGMNWTGRGGLTPPVKHSAGDEIEYFESVAVAFSRRPYIHELHGELLIRTDPALVASLSTESSEARLSIALPFAALSGQQAQVFTPANVPNLLRVHELRLPFSFEGLPTTINQDVVITISVGGRNYTKIKRMQRYPPPASGSSVLPVQVDHSTKSVRVDGTIFAGNGYYIDYSGSAEFGGYHNDGLSYNGAAADLVRDARRGVNQGMIYELGTFTPEQQLFMLDTLHAGGYKVMYDLMSPLCALRPADTACMHSIGHNRCLNGTGPNCVADSADLRGVLNSTVGLVKDHPAILAYYICDDCCYNDNGTSFQSQAYNYIKELDPYHAVVGAVQCAPSWSFSDSLSQIKPTANLSNPVIGLGEQPATQLSLDIIMQENYGGRFVDSSCNGSWSQCIGGDGILRNGIPFEPLVNCLDTEPYAPDQNDGPTEERFASLAYLGLIEAGMMDHLSFINPAGYQRDTQARLAEEFRELRPSLQGSFGANFSLFASIAAVGADPPSCDRAYLGSCLRAKVWEEEPKPGGGICAHLIVVNINATFPSQFQVTLSGASNGHPVVADQAIRLFSFGKNLSIADNGVLDTDWVSPGGHNVYRIGCLPPKPTPGNILVSVEGGVQKVGPGLFVRKSIFAGDTLWGTVALHDSSRDAPVPYGGLATVRPRQEAIMQSDTAVSRTGRHSVKVVLPTATPLVFPLPGPAVASLSHSYNCTSGPPAASKASWAKTGTAPCPGDLVTGTSVSLPRSKTWVVSMYVQTSPPGTRVAIMDGGWNFTSMVQRNWKGDITASGYIGQPIAAVTGTAAVGTDGERLWHRLEARLEANGNGTASAIAALQLRIAPPSSERGFGATVWFADASVAQAP